METAGEGKLGILSKIKPPRLEDAGLEDCALPPDSIHLAFLKAASAVGSRASSILTGTKSEGCVSDPWVGDTPHDTLGGVQPGSSSPGPCTKEKGGSWAGVGVGGDLVGEWNEEDVKGTDEVVVVGGLGTEKGDDDGGDNNDVSDDDKKTKKPTLVEGYLLSP